MKATRTCRVLVVAALLPACSFAAGAGEPAWRAEILRKLGRRVTFTTGAKSPPLTVLLTELTGCKFICDKTFPRRTQPAVFARNLPASSVLRWVCAVGDGGWVLRDGAVVLCSAEAEWEARKHPARRYDIRRAAPRPKDAEALRAFVQHFIGAPRNHIGGRATLGPDGTLTVTAPEADHQTVAKLVEALATLGPNQSASWQLPARPIPPPGPLEPGRGKPTDDITRKLKKKVSFDFIEAPLLDVLAGFAKDHDISFVVDLASRPDPAKPPTLTLKVTEMELSEALRWIALLNDLDTVHTTDAVLLTGESRAREWNERRRAATLVVHDLAPVLAEGWTADEVVAVLRGGVLLFENADPEDQIVAVGSRVVLWPQQSASAKRAIERVRRPKDAPEPGPAPGERPKAPPISEWETRLRKAIQKRVSVHTDGAPLREVLSLAASALECTLVLNHEWPPSRGARRSYSLHLQDAVVREALDCVCLMAGLSVELRDEALFLSKPKRKAMLRCERIYHADRVVRTPAAARGLARFIERLVRSAGGPGLPGVAGLTTRGRPALVPIKPVYRARPGYDLYVLEAPAEQDLVEALYRALLELKPGQRRTLPNLPGPDARRGLVASLFAEKLPAAVARRLEALADFALVDVPMHEAVAAVATRAKATLILDPGTKLPEAKVTLDAKRMRLADALERIEKQAGATHLPLKHGLLITTPQEARKLRPAPTVLYDARDACPDERSAERLLADLEALGKKSEQWADDHFVLHWRRRLVARTTRAIHAKIRELLSQTARRRKGAQ